MKKALIAVIAPPVMVLFIWLMGETVMHLWNWLLPPMFGWHLITFWQALGLLLLSRIFFGSWGAGGGGRGSRRKARWDKMTPEERDRLRKNWGARCGGLSPASDEGGTPA